WLKMSKLPSGHSTKRSRPNPSGAPRLEASEQSNSTQLPMGNGEHGMASSCILDNKNIQASYEGLREYVPSSLFSALNPWPYLPSLYGAFLLSTLSSGASSPNETKYSSNCFCF